MAGARYRCLVVHSDHLNARKAKKLERLMREEKERLQRSLATLIQQRFACQEDADAAAGAWLLAEAMAPRPVTAEVVEERVSRKRPGPGRPPKGEPRPVEVRHRVVGSIGEPDAERRRAWLERQSCFVLITSVPAEEMDGRRLLEESKGQVGVELRFRFLHNPVFVDAIYLKRRDRLEALAYVFVIACLVYSLLERRVRRALAAQGETLVVPGNRAVDRPTAKSLLEMLSSLIAIRAGPKRRILASPPATQRRTARVLELAGFDLDVYTKVLARPGM